MTTAAPADRPSSVVGMFRASAVLVAAFAAMTLAYTMAMAAFAALAGPRPGAASLLTPEVAARFAGPGWFHGRPSAAAGAVSGGSNLAPSNPALLARVEGDVARIRTENPDHSGPLPVDLVTTSASGFDPHVSPAAARLQVKRVATATGLSEATVAALVERAVEGRTLGLFGSPRVDVVRLDEALDALLLRQPAPSPATAR